ncbi:laminin subunit gamma-1-like isoform X3 [Tigriopus californicus]|uniref:laminin subunit gamma-1-like isoform X3 n=1 Tax=Tigriopus californicus TaxID=6832 RepID=UPI0027DA34CD|nr:laminin subunit gamma-1-like isoform X3 [Tigriopus californicus]
MFRLWAWVFLCFTPGGRFQNFPGSGESYLEATELKNAKACDCNGWSNRCRFNEQLYQERGRGGECLDCEGNRDGPNCERCRINHFFSPIQDAFGRTPCEACNCDPTGSRNLQCSPEGQCECKPGVTGPKCDQCEANYWNFGSLGCQSCGCYPDGSANNNPNCDTMTGDCYCKQNVEGQRCDRCKAGHFHIDKGNEFGCTPCFCYGHTSECDLSGGFTQTVIRSDFSRSSEDWTSKEDQQDLPLKYDGINKYIGVQSSGYSSGPAYFLAPPGYLGDQRASYNQDLKFKLRINDVGPRPSVEDVIIEGGGAKTTRITLSITDQNNPQPSYEMQDYTYRLHENPEFGWSPRLSSKDFMAILANITGVMIRGTYVNHGVGFLDEIRLGSAQRGGSGSPATWIERCNCPEGYQGQFCQLCQQGYHHNSGGPFARCIPCSCNGHADICDAETGECACRDNTSGHNCERCKKGYYGNALAGNPDDCQPCPCPDGGACMEIYGNPESPICIECPIGRRGPRCELCEDGYFGDPMGRLGPVRPCLKCDCNNNVDSNAIGNCNSTTGECLRCIDNTDGFNCERCKSGFFGDALALKKPGDPPSCQPCQCYPVGTNHNDETFLPICNGFTGDCSCKPHVVGRDCDKCADGYFNLDSGIGCEACNCDTIGSFNASCHVQTGQCHCREGVTGPRCDMCLPYHFGFSQDGCKPCDCDPTGSTDLQCDLITGQCPCRDKVEGRQCDRCMENTRTKDTGGYGEKICEPCDDCYNLIEDATNEHRRNLAALDNLLQQIAENPEPVGGDFEYQLRQLQVTVKSTLADARINSQNEEGGTLRDRLENLRIKLEKVINLIMEADQEVQDAKNQGSEAQRDMMMAKDIVERAREGLKLAQRQLDTQGQEALRRAQERSKKFGEESEKMTAIAREARTLADGQVEDANEISSIARQAYDKSTEAYNLARDALEQQHRTANQITVLEVQIGDMGDKLRTVQSLASQTLRDSTEAYNEALNIYQQANSLEIPEVDNAQLEDQTVKVSKESKRIQDDATRLLYENGQLLTEAQDRRVQLEDLLRRADAQQRQIDEQLAEIDSHRARALDSVKTGNNVLKDAQNTLKTLKGFESEVSENEETARAAMENINDIENMIREAEEKTAKARNDMVGADISAKLALNVATDAQNIAGEASERAANISSQSEITLEQANGLADSARSLATKLAETKEVVESKEEIATEDEQAAILALSKANEAQQKAARANQKLAQAKKELEEIAAILSRVVEPEPGLLEELARRVEEAEEQFQAEDLDQRLKDLVSAKQRQTASVRDLERELNYLREESENIQAIRDSLPDFCPKSNELCLEDQC